MNKTEIIARDYATKTDLANRLSYANGVKNIVGVKNVNQTIRLRITNTLAASQVVYIAPNQLLGLPLYPSIKAVDDLTPLLGELGLEEGVMMSDIEFIQAPASPANKVLIESLNRDQQIKFLASQLSYAPIQVTGMQLRSFNATTGAGENTNYSNTITHYNVNALREKKYQDLNLSDFQNADDFTTSILKIDFLNNNFICPISQEDLLAIQINANTRLDITLHLGARDSSPERFYRDIKNGTKLLTEQFPDEVGKCACK